VIVTVANNPILRPSPTTPTSALTGFPVRWQIARVAPNGNQTAALATARGVAIDVQTGAEGWAGGGFSFDDFQTPVIETADLTKHASLSFGIRGDLPRVKFEIIDDRERKFSVLLEGVVSGLENVWAIPLSRIQDTIDAGHVRLIYFIIEQTNTKGRVEVNVNPPTSVSHSKAMDEVETSSTGALDFLGMTVYPNPIRRGRATLRLPADTSDRISYRIIDVSGRTSIAGEWFGSLQRGSDGLWGHEGTLDVTGLASGVYALEIEFSNSDGEHRQFRKVIGVIR
jgi:hypothetical protein